MESSRQMYHAVMEEVVRYLERCHQSLLAIDYQQNQVGCRGKCGSLTYINGASNGAKQQVSGNDNNPLSRVRTSTIVLDDLNETVTAENPCNETITSMTSMGSYSNFRDFTW